MKAERKWSLKEDTTEGSFRRIRREGGRVGGRKGEGRRQEWVEGRHDTVGRREKRKGIEDERRERKRRGLE